MTSTPQFNFSQHFSGMIWSFLAVPEKDILVMEVRDDEKFQVTFSALNYSTNQFLWKDLSLKESWWVGLKAANKHLVLFDRFLTKGNPDHKSLIALDLTSKTIQWEIEEFSFFDWDDTTIFGYQTKEDVLPATIDVKTGVVTTTDWKAPLEKESVIANPTQYLEGSEHFDTVKRFIAHKTHFVAVKGVEYVEIADWIVVSVYHHENDGSLANYLLVFTKEGELQLQEKLGEKLQGLGTDTFFMLSGCLFFVKNRSELVAYTLYD